MAAHRFVAVLTTPRSRQVIAGVLVSVVTLAVIGVVLVAMTPVGCGPANAMGIKSIANRCKTQAVAALRSARVRTVLPALDAPVRAFLPALQRCRRRPGDTAHPARVHPAHLRGSARERRLHLLPHRYLHTRSEERSDAAFP